MNLAIANAAQDLLLDAWAAEVTGGAVNQLKLVHVNAFGSECGGQAAGAREEL